MNTFWNKEGTELRVADNALLTVYPQTRIGEVLELRDVCILLICLSFGNCFLRNHPIIKEDGVLAVFLTEPSLEEWRKHNSMVLDEESASKRVDKVEEMAIPSDLEDKIAYVLLWY